MIESLIQSLTLTLRRFIMKTRFSLLIFVTTMLMTISLPAWADDDWDDIDRVSFKNGYAHSILEMARNYFEINGECPSPYWLSKQLKLNLQHPDLFDGHPLEIYEMATSYGGVPEDMPPEERDHYIFYYGGPTGLVSVEIFDSRSNKHYSTIEPDSHNIAQAAEAAEHHVYHEFMSFAKELENGGEVTELIDKYVGQLAFGPNEEVRRHLVTAFQRGLGNFATEVASGTYDARLYAYELGRLRTAVWEEFRDIRDQRRLQTIKYR